MNKELRNYVYGFKKRYPMTIAWRLKQHCMVVEQFLNPGEKVLYAFCGQENDNPLDIITTCVVAFTEKRILIGRKRMLWGYFYHTITPDMYNDLEVKMGLLWGRIHLDTVKEFVTISNLQSQCLPELETKITETILLQKKNLEVGTSKKKD